jgi:hypothetical protein
MRVVLIEIEGLGPTFLAEHEPDNAAEVAGVRGWLARRRLAILETLEDPHGWIGSTLGRLWVRLHRLVSPDEHLLRRLRVADSLAIDHPARMTQEQVESLWSALLARRSRKHRFWLAVDGLLAIPGAFLAVLPGPNLIGYWLAYRAFVHLLAVLGARSGRTIARKFFPHAELDARVLPGDDGQIAGLAAHLDIPQLGLLVAAYAPPTRPTIEGPRCE